VVAAGGEERLAFLAGEEELALAEAQAEGLAAKLSSKPPRTTCRSPSGY
jgi:hypothetical protein